MRVLVLLDFGVGPRPAVSALRLRELNPLRRVSRDHLGGDGKLTKGANCLEVIPSGVWLFGAKYQGDELGRHRANRLIAMIIPEVLQDTSPSTLRTQRKFTELRRQQICRNRRSNRAGSTPASANLRV